MSTVAALKSKLKAIYKAQDMLPKLIEDPIIPEQKMDEYYVVLRMIVGSAGKQRVIQVREIFEQVEDKAEPKNVLIIGKAGIGKSTFLHHILYEWGKGILYQDKFDYIFKIKLKKLVGCTASTLESMDKKDRLPKLIALSLEDQQAELKSKFDNMSEICKSETLKRFDLTRNKYNAFLRKEFPLVEIKKALQEKKKTLLLLDGYDEISHLDRSSSFVNNIMQAIFDSSLKIIFDIAT